MVGVDTTDTEGSEGGNLPRENKTMRKSNKTVNDSSSAHYERQNGFDSVQQTRVNDAQKYYEQQLKENPNFERDRDFNDAQIETLLSGLPIIGPFIQGYNRYQQLTDLYNNSGKIPAYPAISGVGGGQLAGATAHAVASANRIFSGFNDLYEFYSGEPDAFRGMTNFSYM